MIRPFLLSLQFLTRIPIMLEEKPTTVELRRATAFYPAVGLCVGTAAAAVYLISIRAFPPSVSLILAMICLIIITGALHEDGLADCADGFGAGRDPSRILEIMRDSHIGTFGVLSLVFAVGLKFSLLFTLSEWELIRCLIVTHTINRWLALPLAFSLPQARPDGLGQAFSRQVGKFQLLFATFFALAVGVSIYQLSFFALLLPPLVVVALFGFYCYRKIGGITGDCLGAAIQMAEICTYGATAALYRLS